MEVSRIGPLMQVDCSKRHTFPDLTLNLGGNEFSVSPWTYIAELDTDESENAICLSLLFRPLEEDDNYIILGAGFLRGVKLVVDLENDTVGCKYLPDFLAVVHKCANYLQLVLGEVEASRKTSRTYRNHENCSYVQSIFQSQFQIPLIVLSIYDPVSIFLLRSSFTQNGLNTS